MYQSLLTGGRPQTTLTNIITNGNFADGTTGWSGTASALSAANNVLSITGNGASATAYAIQTTSTAYLLDKKVFGRVEFRVTNSVCSKVNLRLYDGANTYDLQTVNSPAQNVWYETPTSLATLIAGGSGNLAIWLYHSYADDATANGKVMEVQEVLATDLTTIFGTGNEPTVAQMDRWLQIFSAGWFDTTKLIPKRIY